MCSSYVRSAYLNASFALNEHFKTSVRSQILSIFLNIALTLNEDCLCILIHLHKPSGQTWSPVRGEFSTDMIKVL